MLMFGLMVRRVPQNKTFSRLLEDGFGRSPPGYVFNQSEENLLS